MRWIAFILLATALTTSAATNTVVFDFTGTDPASNLPWTNTTEIAPGLSTSGWTLGPNIAPVAGTDDAIAFDVQADGTLSTLSNALARGDYLSMTLIPAPGQPFSLNARRVRFSVTRTKWHAPKRFALVSSIDGFRAEAALFQTASIPNENQWLSQFSFIMPQTGYGHITNAVEFRLVACESLFANHPAELNGFSIVSTTNVMPFTLHQAPGGTATANPDSDLFEAGNTIQLQATPDPGFRFAGWTGDIESPFNPASFAITGATAAAPQFRRNARNTMRVSQNLSGVVDWTQEWLFIDKFKLARTWRTQNADGSGEWSTGYFPPVDSNGWPTVSPFVPNATTQPQVVHTVFPVHEPGAHRMIHQGTGTMTLRFAHGSSTQITSSGGTSTNILHPTQTGLHFLSLDSSASHDPLRNIQILSPGLTTNGPTGPFHPVYVQSLQAFRNIRFMNWNRVNGSWFQSWSNRTTPDTYTQTRAEGIAYEYIITLCNLVGAEPWICFPHRAEDELIRKTARLFRDRLDPSLPVYVEYSNETWNNAYPFTIQTTYVQDRGEALGLDPDRWQAGHMYVARRSAEIWDIWRQEFGTSAAHRVVHVMASHSASLSTTRSRIRGLNDPAVNHVGLQADALAIAPYFGLNFDTNSIPPNAPAYPAVDDIVGRYSTQEIAHVRQHVRAHKDLADEQGVRLIVYEGGQHFLGLGEANNDTNLVAILFQANRDPRMGHRYREYMSMLQEEGVDLYANFTYIDDWSKWGTWGVLEYQQQPLSNAPKMQAIAEWMATNRVRPSLELDRESLRGHLPAGRPYRLEYSDALETWTPDPAAPAVWGDGTVRRFPHTLPTNVATRYWRLR